MRKTENGLRRLIMKKVRSLLRKPKLIYEISHQLFTLKSRWVMFHRWKLRTNYKSYQELTENETKN